MAHGSRPTALPPRRSAPAVVVSVRPARAQEGAAARVEVVGVLVVREQDGVDRADVVGGPRRAR